MPYNSTRKQLQSFDPDFEPENLNVEQLLEAFDDDENEYLLTLTNRKIKRRKIKILDSLGLPLMETKQLYDKLIEYRYVDIIEHLRVNTFIRYIRLKDVETVKLSPVYKVMRKDVDKQGYDSLVLTINYKNFIRIRFVNNLVFQKISLEEQMVLGAMKLLNDCDDTTPVENDDYETDNESGYDSDFDETKYDFVLEKPEPYYKDEADK